MKTKLLLCLLVTLCVNASGQSSFNKLIKGVKIVSLPYGSESEDTRQWYMFSQKQPKLHLADSTFIINTLKSVKQTIVNPSGGSAFGNLDWEDEGSSLLGDAAIAILRVIKTPDGHILHIVVGGGVWQGILACVDLHGNLISWMYANGDLGGNSHGNMSREFKMSPNYIVNIAESSWGDNTDEYGFTASYKVVNNKFILIKRKMSKSK